MQTLSPTTLRHSTSHLKILLTSMVPPTHSDIKNIEPRQGIKKPPAEEDNKVKTVAKEEKEEP